MLKWITAVLALGLAAPVAAQPTSLKLWRLDCGNFQMKKFDAWFSDTFQYPAGARELVGSCYLIRHGNDYMLWDAGLTDKLVGAGFENEQQKMWLKASLLDQLKQINVAPAQVKTIGISHWHFDHVGQAAKFPDARLIIGREDAALLRSTPSPDKDSSDAIAHWLSGSGKLVEATGDRDIFGDGSVVMLRMPGHTPGHYALLVRLASGPVLLSGDQYHFTEAVKNRSVPSFNADRADTLASHDRFERLAANLRAKVVIQHEPSDIAKLPAFPEGAE